MLVKLDCLDYDASYSYAPPSVEVVINSDHVLDLRPTDARGIGPFVKITLIDRRYYVARGTVDEIYRKLSVNGN